MEEDISAFEEFFKAHAEKELEDLAAQYPQQRSYGLDLAVLSRFNHELADKITERPDAFMRAAEEAVQRMGFPTSTNEKFAPHVRFFNLPETADVAVQNLGAEHIDKLIRVDGLVSWIAEIKPRVKTAAWECVHCETVTKTYPEKTSIAPPDLCRCGRRNFRLLEDKSEFVNIQRAQIQDPVEKLRGNMPSAHVELWMEDDLVNNIAPGDRITVTGILRLRQLKEGRSRSPVYAKFLDVVHLHKVEREFEELEITRSEEQELLELAKNPHLVELIVKSIAPSIYGHNELKEAIALQLFGGTPRKVMPDGYKIRSDMHILLVGDPGTAKTSILSYISTLAPKCVFVSGGGATGVGLTAAAERDESGEGWILKAGALVLASGGLAVVDEFDKMRDEDRGAIHDAMERQIISIAKAGIVTQFHARTAILAAANPKLGRFDQNTPVAQQFDISPALLSRFDLIFTIRDVLDEAHDRGMAEHILKGHKFAGEKRAALSERDSDIMPAVPTDLLRKYIAYARRSVFPVLTDEASEKIKEFFIELRKLGMQQNTFPITARQIEGVIRLSEASAKMRLSTKVEVRDAERAIYLVNYVLKDVFVDRETGKIDSDVILIGQSKSRLDKIRSLLGVVSALERTMDLVSVEDVVREAARYGMEESYARRLVEELKRQGDLYEPKVGFVKSSRGKAW
jgi:replicative DNA helicase Mcm